MRSSSLIAVSLGDGLVLWHSREEWDAFMHGLDAEAIEGMLGDIDESLRRPTPGPDAPG